MVAPLLYDSLVSEMVALAQVVMIDVVLAGDNAIVVGIAAAHVEASQRLKVVFWGVVAAVVLRILFSLVTVQLLAVVGLTLAGGLLLLWVCWKLFRETRANSNAETPVDSGNLPLARKSMRAAIGQIIIADVSMSLDNVLAVAGAAREHTVALVAGLVLSVALMGAAASVIAPLFKRWPWLAYIGLVVILYVALTMIWDGSGEVLAHVTQK